MVVITLQEILYQVLHFLRMFCLTWGSLLNKSKISVHYTPNRDTMVLYTMPVFGWD